MSSKSLSVLCAYIVCFFSASICSNAAVSNVLGVSKITIPAGNVPISSAYVHPQELGFAVDSTSLSGDELTIVLPAASLVAGDYDELIYPLYYIEVTEEGAFEGMYFDVVSNSTTSITIQTWDAATDPVQPITANSSVALRKHMTVADFFSDAESSLIAFADSIKIFLPTGGSISLFWNGSIWTPDLLNVSDEGNMPLYPGQGFLAAFFSEVAFNVIGEVKATPTQVPVYSDARVINLVGSLSPIPETLDSLDSIDWMLPFAESVKFFTSDGSLGTVASYFSNISFVTDDLINGVDAGSTSVGAHTAYLVSTFSDKNIILPAAYPVD